MFRPLCTLAVTLFAAVGSVHAANQTLVGTNFDVIYNDATLGLFGAPTLVGDTLFFTPNAFSASSVNGGLLDTSNSTISGIVLVAKNGFQFGAIALGEAGDYRLSGASSFVKVEGRLIAFDTGNSLQTYTPTPIVVSAGTPLTLADGALHDWVASSVVNASSSSLPPLPGLLPLTGWLDDAARVGVSIENLLSAYTAPGVNPSEAFIEKKFAGIQLTVSPVPEPGTWALMLSGLLVGAAVLRRAR